MQGTVRHFNAEKRFGFIGIHPAAADFFFDARQVIGEPVKRGDVVEFWLDDDSRVPGRLVAVEVKQVSAEMLTL